MKSKRFVLNALLVVALLALLLSPAGTQTNQHLATYCMQ